MILQSDNGREFTANIITELKSLWPDLKIVHGRPRHPQSQHSVERVLLLKYLEEDLWELTMSSILLLDQNLIVLYMEIALSHDGMINFSEIG
jgi:hypothetical protein